MWPKQKHNDHLKSEIERQKTFSLCAEWTEDDKVKLAKYGFYYCKPSTNLVKCYFCNLEMSCDRNENILREHLRWSPGCRLLNHHRSTENIQINCDELDTILSSINVGRSKPLAIEYRPGSYPESMASAIHSTEIKQELQRGDYHRLSQRLRSFKNWPNLDNKPNPDVLCEAGFFYAGQHDQIRCFSCGGGLEDLNAGCDPWELHAMWYENCSFLKNSKPISFIVNVKKKYLD